MWLCSQRHISNPTERLFIPNDHFNGLTASPGRKGGTFFEVRKVIPYNHVDLPPLVSIESTAMCIEIVSSEVLFAVVYKSPGHALNYTGITELLSFRHKYY
jgi:hypothetical protein